MTLKNPIRIVFQFQLHGNTKQAEPRSRAFFVRQTIQERVNKTRIQDLMLKSLSASKKRNEEIHLQQQSLQKVVQF